MSKFEYDYYAGAECEQFRYVKIPKVFFEDPDYAELGLAECVLYGFLHEQVAESKKNGWIDEQGHTYIIRSIESIQKLLRKCSEDKARSTLKNLIDFGLIEKKRRGQGKSDLIYVKNFVSKKTEKSYSENSEKCGILISEPEKNEVLSEKKTDSGVGKKRTLESGKSGRKETLYKETKYIEPHHNPISTGKRENAFVDNSGSDEDEMEMLIEQIKTNIDYDALSVRYREAYNNCFEELYQIMVDMVIGKRKTLRIGDTEYPQSLVCKRILSLDSMHVEYVMDMIAENTGKIGNMRKYAMAALFNAPTTRENYYTQRVQHDNHVRAEEKKKSPMDEQILELEAMLDRNCGVI